MEEYIELKDKFKIDDSHSNIRGFLVARTEDGKIVFTKENMIVKSGRKLILKMLMDGETLPDIYPASGNEYRMTLPEDNITTGEDLYKVFGAATKEQVIGEKFTRFEIGSGQTEDDLPAGQYYVNLDNLYIRFKLRKAANISGGGTVVSSFGLAYTSNTDTGYELFSRVTFPSYPDSATLIFDYYIYF